METSESVRTLRSATGFVVALVVTFLALYSASLGMALIVDPTNDRCRPLHTGSAGAVHSGFMPYASKLTWMRNSAACSSAHIWILGSSRSLIGFDVGARARIDNFSLSGQGQSDMARWVPSALSQNSDVQWLVIEMVSKQSSGSEEEIGSPMPAWKKGFDGSLIWSSLIAVFLDEMPTLNRQKRIDPDRLQNRLRQEPKTTSAVRRLHQSILEWCSRASNHRVIYVQFPLSPRASRIPSLAEGWSKATADEEATVQSLIDQNPGCRMSYLSFSSTHVPSASDPANWRDANHFFPPVGEDYLKILLAADRRDDAS